MSEKFKTLTRKKLADLNAPEGRAIMAVTYGEWYRAKNGLEALEGVRKRRGKGRVYFFDVSADTQINELGSFVHFPPDGRRWDDATEEEKAEWKRVTVIGQFGR